MKDIQTYVCTYTRTCVCIYTRPLLSIQGWLISACTSLTDRYGPGNDTRCAFLFLNEEENDEQKERKRGICQTKTHLAHPWETLNPARSYDRTNRVRMPVESMKQRRWSTIDRQPLITIRESRCQSLRNPSRDHRFTSLYASFLLFLDSK